MFWQMATEDGINLKLHNFLKCVGSTILAIDGYIEFIDSPPWNISAEDAPWSLKDQVKALERWYAITGIKYALDESP